MWRAIIDLVGTPVTPSSSASFPLSLPAKIAIVDFITLAVAAVIIAVGIGVQDYLDQRKMRCICGHKEIDHVLQVIVMECRLCRCRQYIVDLYIQP